MLSLYSTRTQNTWRRGLALGNAPDARILRYPTQNKPTCWYILRWLMQIFCISQHQTPDAKPKICVSPDANLRRQSVEYRWRWVPTQNSGVGHVHFILLCRFHSRWVANANSISSGIWALKDSRSIQSAKTRGH